MRPVRSSAAVTLATLGSLTALASALWSGSTGALRVMSVKASWSLLALTSNEGPIIVGYAYGDYTVTEIKEAIEASTAIDLGNKIAQEQANRLIRIVGTMGDEGQDDLNNGDPITTKLNWRFNAGKALNIFAYNDGAAALTTGAIVHHNGTIWVKDV